MSGSDAVVNPLEITVFVVGKEDVQRKANGKYQKHLLKWLRRLIGSPCVDNQELSSPSTQTWRIWRIFRMVAHKAWVVVEEWRRITLTETYRLSTSVIPESGRVISNEIKVLTCSELCEMGDLKLLNKNCIKGSQNACIIESISEIA